MTAKESIASVLKRHDGFLLAIHVNPDGDALGSAIALSLALDSMGKKSLLYSRDGVPEHLRFLPCVERVRDSLTSLDTAPMTLVLIDCNAPERAAIEGAVFMRSVVIDHHETERDFGEPRWVEADSPATGLMVFDLLRHMGIEFTLEIARNLYVAIAVDTGAFRFSNTTPAVLRAAAELVEAGAEPGLTAENLYQGMSANAFRLFLKNLSGMELTGAIALSAIDRETFRETNTGSGDTENFVNFPLTVKDVKVAVLIRESEEGWWKVSIRSKGDINVARVAELFKGGGHRNAAGCHLKGELREVRERLLAALKELPGID